MRGIDTGDLLGRGALAVRRHVDGETVRRSAAGHDTDPLSSVRMVVRYVRSLCRDPAWPPGELNFPRAFLVEKAYPENELVLVAHGHEQQAIYERRIGRRFQFEAEVVALFDSLDRPFEGGSASLKYNVWHSLDQRALATLGAEVTPPLGRRDHWEIDPYIAGGIERARFDLQFQLVSVWEEAAGVSGASYRVSLGRRTGRFTPTLEAGWDVPREGPNRLSLYPQLSGFAYHASGMSPALSVPRFRRMASHHPGLG